jgi:hypothetical protein
MLDIPAVTYDCGAGKDTRFNDSKQCLSGATSDRYETGLPNSCWTPAKTHASVRSMPQLYFLLLKQLSSISTTLPSFPPPQPIPKKAVWKNPNEDQYCLAAEQRPVSNSSLVVNVEFRMTLMGQGMAPHFQRKCRQ